MGMPGWYIAPVGYRNWGILGSLAEEVSAAGVYTMGLEQA